MYAQLKQVLYYNTDFNGFNLALKQGFPSPTMTYISLV